MIEEVIPGKIQVGGINCAPFVKPSTNQFFYQMESFQSGAAGKKAMLFRD